MFLGGKIEDPLLPRPVRKQPANRQVPMLGIHPVLHEHLGADLLNRRAIPFQTQSKPRRCLGNGLRERLWRTSDRRRALRRAPMALNFTCRIGSETGRLRLRDSAGRFGLRIRSLTSGRQRVSVPGSPGFPGLPDYGRNRPAVRPDRAIKPGDVRGQVPSDGERGNVLGSSQCIRSSQPSRFAAMRQARMCIRSETLVLVLALAAWNTGQQRS